MSKKYLQFYSKSVKRLDPKLYPDIARELPDDAMKHLSNFSEHDVEYDGHMYPTVEHAFQALKYSCTENPELVDVIREQYKNKTANEAKSSGSRSGMKKMNVALNIRCWDERKDGIMRTLIESKISRHPEIQQILEVVRDKNYILIHHARTDMEWGAHVNHDEAKNITGIKEGANKLGEIYMSFANTPPPPSRKARKARSERTISDSSTDDDEWYEKNGLKRRKTPSAGGTKKKRKHKHRRNTKRRI